MLLGRILDATARREGGRILAGLIRACGNFDIAEELNKNGYKVVKAQIRMPNGPIKLVGDSTVSVALHTDVVVDITVSVYGETA